MSPFVNDPDFVLHVGDALEVLGTLPDESVHCVVTSPPYWGLRDYGTEGQLGLEPTPEEYVSSMVAVFREVRRVLRRDGTCWLNIGSSYNSNGPGGMSGSTLTKGGTQPASSREVRRRARPYDSGSTAPQDSPDLGSACSGLCDEHLADFLTHRDRIAGTNQQPSRDAQPAALTGRDTGQTGSASTSPAVAPPDAQASTTLESWLRPRGSCSRCDKRAASLSDVHSSSGDAPASAHTSWLNYTSRLKPKDLVPIPWMLAMALQEDGWYLRCDVIWAKKNCMPESCTDRPTKSHEYVLLLTKSPTYFYDADAIREPLAAKTLTVREGPTNYAYANDGGNFVKTANWNNSVTERRHNHAGANKRTVWEIATEPYPDAHFATFPQALVEPCVLAGTSERGCCPECGAPWEREVEKTPLPLPNVMRDDSRGILSGGGTDGANDSARRKHMSGSMWRKNQVANPPRDLGWRPTCRCYDSPLPRFGYYDNARSVPCTVLDPFMGSGTVAVVARRLGRRAVGIELNPEYALLAAKRLAQLSLLAA